VALQARLFRERAARSNTKELVRFAESDVQRATETLTRAIDMARSNPFLYIDAAELALMTLRQKALKHESIAQPYQEIIAACQKALVAKPDLADAYELMATAEAAMGEALVARGEDPSQAMERGEAALSEAERLNPSGETQLLSENRLNRVLIVYQLRHGQEAMPTLAHAADVARNAVERKPGRVVLWVDLGRVHMLRADYQAARGQDQRPDLEEALAAFQHEFSKQPEAASTQIAVGLAKLRLGRRAIEHGEDPRPLLRQATENFLAATSLSPDDDEVVLGPITAQTMQAEYAFLSGAEPMEPLAAAIKEARGIATQNPSWLGAQSVLIEALHLQAQVQLGRGQDPTAVLDEARRLLNSSQKLSPGDPDALALEAELELQLARWQQRQHRPADLYLRNARAALAASLQTNDQRAATYIAQAKLALLQLETAAPQEAAAVLADGLQDTAKALDIAPGTPAALLVQGQLLLAQAQRAPVGTRASIAEPALAALNQAFKLDPLLKREGAAALQRAQELLGDRRGPHVIRTGRGAPIGK
jgi:tetratricopeptide (TPR) repeat protein